MTAFSVRLRRTAAYTTILTMAAFGFTSMASAQSITNTGPGSSNNITTNVTNNCTVTNTNVVSATNTNSQNATTGDANVGSNAVLPWAGWDKLAPESAQGSGEGYADWWGNVLNWVSARATGQGWSDPANLQNWTPATGDWAQWDPVAWQQQGHSFSDWFAGVQGYMNTNSPVWLVTWPQVGGNTLGGDATTGDATNVNNASFTINILNRAPVDACGYSVVPVVPPVNPPSGGGSGGGSWVSPASYSAPKSYVNGGSGGSGSYGGYSSYAAPHYSTPKSTYVAPATVTPSAPVTPTTPTVPVTPVTPPAPANTISNTGPGSSNNITSNYTDNSSVTNTNTVSTVSINQQSASSGDANVSDNTSAGGAGTGGASNANGVSDGVTIVN